jgi:hypothetical protein
MTANPQPTGPSLALDGDTWDCSFEGQRVLLRDSRGLGYIAFLLSRPNQEVPILQLATHDATIREFMELEKEDGSPFLSPDSPSSHHRITMAHLKEMAWDNLDETIHQSKRARGAVSKAIHRDLGRIAKHHPPLARHLRIALKPITLRPVYRVQPVIHWQVTF